MSAVACEVRGNLKKIAEAMLAREFTFVYDPKLMIAFLTHIIGQTPLFFLV